MAKVDDATTAVGADASWFKINEMGMPSDAPDYWATEVLNVRGLMCFWKACVLTLITGQLWSLHLHDSERYGYGSVSPEGRGHRPPRREQRRRCSVSVSRDINHEPELTRVRFYMSCFQLNVGGTGNTNPPTVKIPGAYGGRALPLTIQEPY